MPKPPPAKPSRSAQDLPTDPPSSANQKDTTREKNQGIDRRLLEILVCPATKGPLRYDPKAGELISEQAGLAYPVRDGIPIMLIDEARQLDE